MTLLKGAALLAFCFYVGWKIGQAEEREKAIGEQAWNAFESEIGREILIGKSITRRCTCNGSREKLFRKVVMSLEDTTGAPRT